MNLLPHAIMISMQYFKEVLIVYCGTSATKEAEKTPEIVARLMISADSTEGLDKFLLQIGTRNVNFQTIFFNVNWNVLVAVSFWGCLH